MLLCSDLPSCRSPWDEQGHAHLPHPGSRPNRARQHAVEHEDGHDSERVLGHDLRPHGVGTRPHPDTHPVQARRRDDVPGDLRQPPAPLARIEDLATRPPATNPYGSEKLKRKDLSGWDNEGRLYRGGRRSTAEYRERAKELGFELHPKIKWTQARDAVRAFEVAAQAVELTYQRLTDAQDWNIGT